MKGNTPGIKIHLTQEIENNIEISFLENSFYYFLECVYILKKINSFQLIVIHNNRLLKDKTFGSLSAAKRGFIRSFKWRLWKEGVKAKWSQLSDSESKWVQWRMKQQSPSIHNKN